MFALTGLSCDSEMALPNPVSDDKKAQVQVDETSGQNQPNPIEYVKEEVWVCYNPGTEMHNQECVEETYPEYEINEQDSLVSTLNRIDSQLDQLRHYLNNDSKNIDDK
mgnify:CR=1 FL=1